MDSHLTRASGPRGSRSHICHGDRCVLAVNLATFTERQNTSSGERETTFYVFWLFSLFYSVPFRCLLQYFPNGSHCIYRTAYGLSGSSGSSQATASSTEWTSSNLAISSKSGQNTLRYGTVLTVGGDSQRYTR